MDRERFQKQLDFILEIDKEKQILRQTRLTGHGRRENDAEHAWHAAVMTWLLAEYSNEPFDAGKAMLMILTHDLVEIYAGDTYAYDTDAKKTEAAREHAAADRLFGLLPDDQKEKLSSLWEEFGEGTTPEARFAHVMDNFQPMLLNDSNGGGDWAEHGIRRAQPEERNKHTAEGSEIIRKYMDEIFERNVERGSLKP